MSDGRGGYNQYSEAYMEEYRERCAFIAAQEKDKKTKISTKSTTHSQDREILRELIRIQRKEISNAKKILKVEEQELKQLLKERKLLLGY